LFHIFIFRWAMPRNAANVIEIEVKMKLQKKKKEKEKVGSQPIQ